MYRFSHLLCARTKEITQPKAPSEFIEITAGNFYQRLPLSIGSIEVAEAYVKGSEKTTRITT